MSEGAPRDEAPELRLKRLAMRSWRRGTKEMDLILGPYADARLAVLPPEALDRYEALLSENDQDLYRWISGSASIPAQHRAVVGDIREDRGL